MTQPQILTTLDHKLQEVFGASGTERKEVLRYIRYNLVELSRELVDELAREDIDSLRESALLVRSFAYNLEWEELAEICEDLLGAIERQERGKIAANTTKLADCIKPVTEAPFRLKRRFFLR